MNHPRRRTVVKGAAWAAPAVAAASAIPAYAASSTIEFMSGCAATGCSAGQPLILKGSRKVNGTATVEVWVGFTAKTDIPAGTVVSWDITVPYLSDDASFGTCGKASTQVGINATYEINSIEKTSRSFNNENFTEYTYHMSYTLGQSVPAGGKICAQLAFQNCSYMFRSNHRYPGVTIHTTPGQSVSVTGTTSLTTPEIPATTQKGSAQTCY